MRPTLRFAPLAVVLALIVTLLPLSDRNVASAASLKVQYRAFNTNPTDGEITPWFRIVNSGSSSAALSELKLRYWYTVDGDTAQQAVCDWAQAGCANLTKNLVRLSSPQPGADYYLEIGFGASAGHVDAGSYSEIQMRIHKSDWSAYDESDDYSFDATKTSFADWDRVTLYHNGTLIWGSEPGGASATATPTSGAASPTPTATSSPNTPTPTPTGVAVTPTPTSAPSTPTPTSAPPPSGKRVIGYFVQWGVYQRNYHVKNIDTSGSAARLTHINYAFANISSDYKCQIGDSYADYDRFYDASASVDGVADTWDAGVLRGSFNQLRKLKQKHPHLKVLISIGGWTWSSNFSSAALPENRAAFVKSCIDMFIKGQFTSGLNYPGIFDGIDIDWEYPGACGATCNYRPEDTQNFTALLAEFRSQLNQLSQQTGRQYLLTIAAPAGQEKIDKIEVGKIHQYLDFINLMTYDFHGAWENRTNFQSALYPASGDPDRALKFTTHEATRTWLDRGTPAGKLVVGVPFYGRGWQGVPGTNNGLWQSAGGAAPGTYENGIEDYKVLKTKGYSRFFNSEAQAAWLYSGGYFWTFDDPPVMRAKTSYVKANSLGGVMFWELSGDTSDGELITTIYDGLN